MELLSEVEQLLLGLMTVLKDGAGRMDRDDFMDNGYAV